MKPVLVALMLMCLFVASAFASPASSAKATEQRIAITVTSKGFEPASVHLKVGRPVKLVVTRKVERTCVTDIVISDFGIKQPLPLNKPVEVRFSPRKLGAIRYACAMDMVAGSLIVE